MNDDVCQILRDHARLSVDPGARDPQADLYEMGMTSHASVNVMLAVEDHFDIEFPDAMLKPSVFASVAAIAAAVEQLRATEAVG